MILLNQQQIHTYTRGKWIKQMVEWEKMEMKFILIFFPHRNNLLKPSVFFLFLQNQQRMKTSKRWNHARYAQKETFIFLSQICNLLQNKLPISYLDCCCWLTMSLKEGIRSINRIKIIFRIEKKFRLSLNFSPPFI